MSYDKCVVCNKDLHTKQEAMDHNCTHGSINFGTTSSLAGRSVLAQDLTTTKAAKNDKEKVDLSLIPYVSNLEHARAFMVGERKYGRYNYCLGHEASQLVAAAERHLQAWFNGEERDPIDGQHHLGSAMACCSMILRQQELGTLKDNRYKKGDK